MIQQAFIHTLLDRTNIVDVIQSRIELKKNGNRYKARCPFHDEKTPSFSVNADRQFFYCFGCGAHGDTIEFVMRYDHLDFIDAVAQLASNAGLEVPKDDGSPETKIDPELYRIMGLASQHYQDLLKGSNEAITYLKGRGITGQIAKQFAIGFVPDQWDNLLPALKNEPNAQSQLVETGMLIEKSSQRHYDRFRGRIMFPIRDTRGRVIAFGGRILDKGEPKYLNSPETPIFHKGAELYGLFEALQSQKTLDKVVIVEGYMDVVALAQFGIDYAVATLGTATSNKHLQKLFRYTHTVIFCFDGDKAGRAAAWKALLVNLPQLRDGIHIRFCFLPDGEDPDSYIQTRGKPAFETQLHNAIELPDFLFMHLDEKNPLNSLADKAEYAKSAKTLIDTMPQGLFRQLLYQRLADHLHTAVEDLNQLRSQPDTYSQKPEYEETAPQQRFILKHPLTPTQHATALLLQKPDLLQYAPDPLFAPEDTPDDGNIRLLSGILRHMREKPNAHISELLSKIDNPELSSYIAALAAWEFPIPDEGLKAEFLDTIERIIGLNRQDKIDQLINKSKKSQLSDIERQQLKEMLLFNVKSE
jgi:DNA primase